MIAHSLFGRGCLAVAAIAMTCGSAMTAPAARPAKEVRFQELPTWNVEITMRRGATAASIDHVRKLIVESDAIRFATLTRERQRQEFIALAGEPLPASRFVLGMQWRVQARRAVRRPLAQQVRHQKNVSDAQVGSFADPMLGACAQRDQGVRLEAFMNVDATAEEIGAVRAVLDASPVVDRYEFFDKAAALKEFKRIFRKDPELVKNITAAELPTSFRIVPTEQADFGALVTQVEAMAGVDDVATPEDTFRDLDCERLAAIP